MADFNSDTTVEASADALFDYLADVGNLPRYFSSMTSAQPGEGEEVRTTARLPDGREVQGEAWFRIDANRRTIEWGSEGPSHYGGNLEVRDDGERSRVTVRLHTTRVQPGDEEVQAGLERTLANVKRLVEEHDVA